MKLLTYSPPPPDRMSLIEIMFPQMSCRYTHGESEKVCGIGKLCVHEHRLLYGSESTNFVRAIYIYIYIYIVPMVSLVVEVTCLLCWFLFADMYAFGVLAYGSACMCTWACNCMLYSE